MPAKEGKRPAHRPSLYDSAYCERMVEFCRDGSSLTDFADEIGVDRKTISNWADAHPEFLLAVGRAKAACARWWGMQARKVASEGGPGGQATMVIFGLKNHAPDDYQDRQQHELSGPGGKPIEHRIDAPMKETREEWLARQRMGAAAGAAIGGDPGDVVR